MPLFAAALCHHPRVVAQLLEAGAPVNAQVASDGSLCVVTAFLTPPLPQLCRLHVRWCVDLMLAAVRGGGAVGNGTLP